MDGVIKTVSETKADSLVLDCMDIIGSDTSHDASFDTSETKTWVTVIVEVSLKTDYKKWNPKEAYGNYGYWYIKDCVFSWMLFEMHLNVVLQLSYNTQVPKIYVCIYIGI